jgi:glycolate oxidase FAD binding subunit
VEARPPADVPLCGDAEKLRAEIERAYVENTPVDVVGGGTRSQLGRAPRDDSITLHVSGYGGIELYEPSELVVRVRAGTLLSELEAVLAANGQMLGPEPLISGADGTVGGAVATGLSGPGRPWWGSLRDVVLGVDMINGRGERLAFGGRVFKNVAGYDVSRLMVGAWGTLGVLLAVTLRVQPVPEASATLSFAVDDEDDAEFRARLLRRALPVSAVARLDGRTFVRLSGSEAGVASARRTLGGDGDPEGDAFWRGLRDHSHEFFGSSRELIRVVCHTNAANPDLPGRWLLNWGGAERWLATAPCDHPGVFDAARHIGASATLFRSRHRSGRPFQPLEPSLYRLHQRLKQAFDPNYVLNPGRMYAGL